MKSKKPAYIAVCGIVLMCLIGFPSAYSLISKSLIYDFGWTDARAALPSSVYAFFYAGGMLGAGVLQKKINPGVVGALSGLCVLIGFLLSGLTLSLPVILVGYGVLGGLGVAGLYSVGISVPPSFFSEKTANRVTGIIIASFGIAPLVYSQILSRVIGAYGVRWAFLSLAILVGVLGTFLASRMQPEVKVPANDAVDAAVSTAGTQTSGAKNSGKSITVRDLMKDPAALCMSVWFFTHGYVAFVLTGHLANIAYRQAGIENAAFLIGLYGVVNMLIRIVVGFLDVKKVMYIYYPIAVINAILVPHYNSMALLSIAVIVTAIGFGMPAVAIPACIRRIYGQDNFSTIYGFVALFSGVGTSLSTYLTGLCVDLTGGYVWAFLGSALCSAATFATLRVVFKRM